MSEEFREAVDDALRLLVDTDSTGKNYIASGWVFNIRMGRLRR